jgi:hypothetical protein
VILLRAFQARLTAKNGERSLISIKVKAKRQRYSAWHFSRKSAIKDDLMKAYLIGLGVMK